MNMFKKVFAVILCITMLAGITATSAFASAEEATATIEGIRWFPVPAEKQNDEAWEVECIADGCLCQRFNDEENTGNRNYLDTEYTADGGLTISRNDATIMMGDVDYTENFWPRIRTIWLETSPEFDMKVADTFYFDFTVPEGTQWNIMLSINSMNVKLSKIISDACGVSGVATSDNDGVAGTYKGSFNIWTALDEIAKESGTESSVNAQALKNMKKTFVPQIAVFCVGPQTASLTLNEMFISTAADTTGEKCSFVDMGLLSGLGEEYYEMMDEEEPAGDSDESVEDPGNEPAAPGEGPEGDNTPAVGDEEEEDTTTTTTASKKDDKNEGGSALPIIIVVVAVVVVAAVVAVIVIKKKKA